MRYGNWEVENARTQIVPETFVSFVRVLKVEREGLLGISGLISVSLVESEVIALCNRSRSY